MALKQGLTLLQLALKTLSIPPRGEGLSMSVFLMAWRASVGTCSTPGMFRVALRG